MSGRSKIPRWLPGMLLMASALGLAMTYRLWPPFSEGWSESGYLMFWAILVLLMITGVVRLIIDRMPASGRVGTSSPHRHRVLILKEGLVYLVIMIVLFVGSLLGHENMLMLVFAMLAGPFVINGWAAFAMLKGSQVARHPPRRAMCGELFAVELTLRNVRSWFSLWMMQVSDTVSGCGETLTPTNLFTCVPPGGRATGHYTLRLRHRGVYKFGPLHVTSRFPLGLIERGEVFPVTDQILVYPRIGRLTPQAHRQLLGADELSNERRPQAGIFHDEFHHLREYRSGDNPRAIHWRTSARRGALILREYEQHREQQLSLVVDLWEPGQNATPLDRERTEWALCLAATICLEQRRQARDSRLSLHASGKTALSWEGRVTSASLESLLDELAVIQAGSAEQTGELLHRAWQMGTSLTRFFVISTRSVDRETWRQRLMERLPSGAAQRVNWLFVDPAAMERWVRFEDESLS